MPVDFGTVEYCVGLLILNEGDSLPFRAVVLLLCCAAASQALPRLSKEGKPPTATNAVLRGASKLRRFRAVVLPRSLCRFTERQVGGLRNAATQSLYCEARAYPLTCGILCPYLRNIVSRGSPPDRAVRSALHHVNALAALWRAMEDKTVLAAFMVAMMVMAVASTFSDMEDRMDSQQDYAESLNDRTDQTIESVEGTLASHEANMGHISGEVSELETDLEAEADSLEDKDDELAARDNELAAEADQMQGMVTMHSQALQGLSEDVTLLMDGPQWVNEVGTADDTWTLALNDSQWLEVKSATYIRNYGENTSNGYWESRTAAIFEEGGWSLPSEGGYSTIFGGSYSLCVTGHSGPSGLECTMAYSHEDWSNGGWSVIYRIHDV